ncbi:rRNA maturation RNase YbeY [Geochorda subterranea]|uniref:Endoribonuclease YbeY n=1 Tax=Geochorda subterranea TaxID=3109564 RepID=A0ABZ1BLS7_9FIRM|nr:rRNA maturation RNase YbeY [Limnochorda sp. LNt]WRP13506.1 rRNA maturation RNase YbeY [Limnochorda sp. LNt]
MRASERRPEPFVVRVHNHQREVAVSGYLRRRLLHRAVREVLRRELGPEAGRPREVSVALVDEPTIAALNRRFRGVDAPTDVLSFKLEDPEEPEPDPAPDPAEPQLLGEIVISVPRAVAQAEAYGHSVERELAYLAVHGCLHLLGYDHEDEPSRQAMRQREEAALSACGLTR